MGFVMGFAGAMGSNGEAQLASVLHVLVDLGVAFSAHCGPRLGAVQIQPAASHVVDINAFGAIYPPRMQHPARFAIGMRCQEIRTQSGILLVLFGALFP
jgi:hypothetical protein